MRKRAPMPTRIPASDKTCYLFSASSRTEENLDILLSFVSRPYFTEKTIAKDGNHRTGN